MSIHGPLTLPLPDRARSVLAETFRPGDGCEVLFWLGPCDERLDVAEVPGSTIRWNGRDYRALSCARLARTPDYQETLFRTTITAIRELP